MTTDQLTQVTGRCQTLKCVRQTELATKSSDFLPGALESTRRDSLLCQRVDKLRLHVPTKSTLERGRFNAERFMVSLIILLLCEVYQLLLRYLELGIGHGIVTMKMKLTNLTGLRVDNCRGLS